MEAPAAGTAPPEYTPETDPAAEVQAAARWVDAWYRDPKSWPPLMTRLARLRAAFARGDTGQGGADALR